MDKEKVLIIKTGYSEVLDEDVQSRRVSLGDVLRTTPILHLYKNADVTWVSDEHAFPLLKKNPYIERLLPFDWISGEHLKLERFDTIINLEKVLGICALADSIYAVKRYGFRFDPVMRTAKAYEKAIEILTVSSDINVKKENKKTVQELLFELVGEKWNGEEYILGYQPRETEKFDVAFNIHVGGKWPIKAWPTKNWDDLEKMLSEKFRVTRQDRQDKNILSDLYRYMDWLNSSKLIVTNDSLGMHLAISFKKKFLGLFGPTPHRETHFYNRGKAILPIPVPDCLPCFKEICEKDRTCMEDISVERVYQEINNIL